MTPLLSRATRLQIGSVLAVLLLVVTACGGETLAPTDEAGSAAGQGSDESGENTEAADSNTSDPADQDAGADGHTDANDPDTAVPGAGPVDQLLEPVADNPTPQLPATFEDAVGNSITVTDIDRIVPLSGSLAEIVFSLGLGDHVVARDVAANFPEAEHIPVVTEGHEVSAEGVLSTRPTVVLTDGSVGPPEAIDAIRSTGIPVVQFDEAWTIDDIAPRLEAVAHALGVDEAGEVLVQRTEDAVADARVDDLPGDSPPQVAFLYLRGTAAVYLIGGEGSGADAMIEAVGGVDAGKGAGLSAFTPITSEALISAAPDVILVMDKGLDSVGGVDGLRELPGIAQTPAGRENRVIAMDDSLLLSFGPRTGEALHELADELVAVLEDDGE